MDALDAYDSDCLSLLSSDRRSTARRTLARLSGIIAPRPLTAMTGIDVTEYLAGRVGLAPGTLRKERAVIVAFCGWAHRSGVMNAETLLEVRAVPEPDVPRLAPRPYTRAEVRAMWFTVAERWPRLTDHDARRKVERWDRGTGTYAALRPHAIRLQLEAIISLATVCCLRPREIERLGSDDAHPENEYIVAHPTDVRWANCRPVPHAGTQQAVGDWLAFREVLNPGHDNTWLALWAEPTARQPIKHERWPLLLSTYVMPGLSLRRLRDTGAVQWARAGMPVGDLQELLGLASGSDVAAYYDLAGSTMLRRANALTPALSATLLPKRLRAAA